MKNIVDYAKNYTYLFSEQHFNEVDGLILSQLCYLNLDEYSDRINSGVLTLFDLSNDRSSTLLKIRVPKRNSNLLTALANNPRFKDVKIIAYESARDKQAEKQFSATIYSNGDVGYVAFRGTDSTVVGWKEDFNAMFMDFIPSQQASVDFVIKYKDILPKQFYIGGHSKGGNLAVYCATNLPIELQNRILAVFDNDGPGVKKEILDTDKYLNVQDKIIYLMPEQSIFGMMLYNNNNYQVVKSDGFLVQQHDPFNWHIVNDCFVFLDSPSKFSSVNRDALNKWLQESNPKDRELFVDTLYNLINIANAEKLSDVPTAILKNPDEFVKALKQLKKEDLDKIFAVLAEYKQYKKEISKATQTENEHRTNETVDLTKIISFVADPIKNLINKLPIDGYKEILNTLPVYKKAKGYVNKIGDGITDTAKYLFALATDKTKELEDFVTVELNKLKQKEKIYKANHNQKQLKKRFVNNKKIYAPKGKPLKPDVKKQTKKPIKKAKNTKALQQTKRFKEQYFDYYDDIKHYSKGEEDW